MRYSGVEEGLNTLNYTVTQIERQTLFTRFYVNYDETDYKIISPFNEIYLKSRFFYSIFWELVKFSNSYSGDSEHFLLHLLHTGFANRFINIFEVFC